MSSSVISSSAACAAGSRHPKSNNASALQQTVTAPSHTSIAGKLSVIGASRIVTFKGMCDASGAVPLSATLFAVADDDDSVLRIYDADRGGAPIAAVDVQAELDLQGIPHKAKHGTFKTDLEAATRIGDEAFWISSHGRSDKGKRKPERLRFFATNVPSDVHSAEPITVLGRPYEHLLDDLFEAPQLQAFDLRAAAALPAKEAGGLNIEGLVATPDKQLWIGFRNPIPQGRALVVPLENPRAIMTGERAKLGPPMQLALGGLGVRALGFWKGAYLIAAGDYAVGEASRLYRWQPPSEPVLIKAIELPAFNPEAFFAPSEREELLLISDDGTLSIDGESCKQTKDLSRRSFRGAWISRAVIESNH